MDKQIFQDFHPLEGKKGWTFAQPTLGIASSLMLLPKDGEKEVLKVQKLDTCRERVISNLRTAFQGACFAAPVAGFAQKATPELNHPELFGPGKTKLLIFPHIDHSPQAANAQERPVNNPFSKLPQDYFTNFPQVMCALVGLPLLLLNPGRQPGNWWRTDESNMWSRPHLPLTQIWYLSWNGADNSILIHPAILAIALGLFRQAHLLHGTGEWGNVLSAVDHEKVEQALTENDRKLAEVLVHKLRMWLNVPPAKAGHGNFAHYPFPWYIRKRKQVSYWQRFVRLYRGLENHGFEAVLNGDFITNWGLANKSPYHSDVFSLWGYGQAQKDDNHPGKLTEDHYRIMRMGARDGEADEE